ncbi:hypothetical protein [Pseudomonas syringae group genomosp. 7]|uniref:hypothetical protein n=1 Tax=Pseudomonas syringae group genomosp. 7 TaxID=251699 RepID=UPI00376FE135
MWVWFCVVVCGGVWGLCCGSGCCGGFVGVWCGFVCCVVFVGVLVLVVLGWVLGVCLLGLCFVWCLCCLRFVGGLLLFCFLLGVFVVLLSVFGVFFVLWFFA